MYSGDKTSHCDTYLSSVVGKGGSSIPGAQSNNDTALAESKENTEQLQKQRITKVTTILPSLKVKRILNSYQNRE